MIDIAKLLNTIRSDSDPALRQIVEDYERRCGALKPFLELNSFYTDYLFEFQTIPYATHDFLPGFDYILFMQLVCGSYNSNAYFVFPDNDLCGLPELQIQVDDKQVYISDLWSFQIENLRNTLIKDQLIHHCLFNTQPFESVQIFMQREELLQHHNSVIEMIALNRLLTSNIYQ